MLFTMLTGPNYETAHAALAQALKRGVDGVEIRLDLFDKLDAPKIEQLRNDATPIEVLFTLRSTAHGGAYLGSEESRLEWIEWLCSLSPEWIDLECDVPLAFRSRLAQKYPKIRFLSSYHNFISTPPDLDALFAATQSPLSHLTKLATMAETTLDTLRMMQCVRKHSTKHHVIGIAMGERGLATRALGPVLGNRFDYTYLNPTEQTALGQLSLDELLTTYHYRSLNPETALFGLIGLPVKQSVGYLLHNAVFDALKINAAYVSLEVAPTELGCVLKAIRTLPFQGLSVTMPLKQAVIPYLDRITPRAQAIGAVNTIEIRKGKLIGHNTDGVGALHAIEQQVSVEGKNIVIIGAGGAAKAIAHEAVRRKAHVTVLNRTASKAEKLAEELHCTGGGLGRLAEIYARGYAIIINCTPDAEPVSPELIYPGCYAMDLTYVPRIPPFLVQAQAKQCHLIHGLEMLIQQAIEQQLIWCHHTQDRARIQEVMYTVIPYPM